METEHFDGADKRIEPSRGQTLGAMLRAPSDSRMVARSASISAGLA
jgi:hypothetical protein